MYCYLKNAYSDLDKAFGDDWDAYVTHYLTVGAKEDRYAGIKYLCFG